MSGKHRQVVSGINLLTPLWTDGERHIPIGFRIYNKSSDCPTKNEHFRRMLHTAAQRGFSPDRTENRPVCEVNISEQVDIVHLKGYGLIKVFRTVKTDDDAEYRATDDLRMNDLIMRRIRS